MGMMEEWNFSSAADFAAFGAPDFPDVHRGWVRREWVSGSQGLINAGELRMRLPKLYDYGGIGHCMLLPNVPYEVCEPEYGQMTPSGVVTGTENQTQSTTQTTTTVQQEPAAQTTTPAPAAPTASPILKAWGLITGVALAGIVVAILK